MKTWKKLSVLCLALLVVFSTAFAATACGKSSRDYTKIRLNEVTHSIFYAPLYVAINKGFFKDEGLSVSFTNGGGSNTSMSALLAGSADIILAGPETVVYTTQEGYSDAPVVFGQLTACDGSFIVGKSENDHFTLNDLKDKTIIGGRKGGMPAMTLQYIIEQEGLTIGTGAGEVNLRTDVEFNAVASVWEGDRTVEYCTLFEPTATNIVNEGKGHVLASVGELSGNIPYTCFITKSSYLKKHSDISEKFLRAVLNANEFIENGDLDEVAQALLPSFDGNTLQEMKNAVIAYKAINAWSDDMILTQDSFNNLMKVMKNAGVISADADWAKCVDNTLAEKIAAEN